MCTTEGWWGWWGRFWRIKDFCEGEKVLWTDLECSLFSVEGSGTLINIINWWGRIWNVDNFFLQKKYYQFFLLLHVLFTVNLGLIDGVLHTTFLLLFFSCSYQASIFFILSKINLNQYNYQCYYSFCKINHPY